MRAINIECSFNFIRGWPYDKDVYSCTVQNFIEIGEPNMIIESASGSKSDEYNVEAIHLNASSSSQVYFFPGGLNAIFTNLKMIYIEGVELKEVHQSDLKPFPQLEVISFYNNKLESLEKDLFKFNPNLHTFGANFNKISFIHPDVFDHLHSLSSLRINGNPCGLSHADKNRDGVLEIIVHMKEQCSAIKTEILEDLVIDDCQVSFSVTK